MSIRSSALIAGLALVLAGSRQEHRDQFDLDLVTQITAGDCEPTQKA